MSGWTGCATYLPDGDAIKDGETDLFWGQALAADHEWQVMRDQTPNPDHPQTEEQWINAKRMGN